MKSKHPSSFKNQIITAFIIVVVLCGVLFSLFLYILSVRRTTASIKIASSALDDFSKISYKLQYDSLEPLAKQYLVSKVLAVSAFLSEEIHFKGEKTVMDDISIRNTVTEYISLNGRPYGNLYLVDNTGIVILSPDKDVIGRNAREICDYSVNGIRQSFDEIIIKDSNSGTLIAKDDKYKLLGILFFASSRITGTKYFLFGVIDLKKFIEPANFMFKEKEKHIRSNLDNSLYYEFHYNWYLILIASFIIIIILCIICSAIGMYFAKRIVRPIMKLQKAIVKISTGNFNVKVEESGTIETIELARAFNHLGGELTSYIENLKSETTRRESIESEIKIARTIQQSILPKLTQPFLRPEFTIVTELMAAKEVAGDFFDFFYLNNDSNRLVMVIGDVSGKGVPAAFFMGVLKSTIRNFCQANYTDSPGEILAKVNKEISSGNSEAMFASIFIMYYDVNTGYIVYANAGHHDSILLKGDSEMRFFGQLEDSLLGIFCDETFKTGSMKLLPGEAVFCYTDGLTDALSPEKKFYGIKSLRKNIESKTSLSPELFVTSVIGEVIMYQNNVIFDDITVLYFKRNT